jgi:hypothetical protein
METGGKTGDRRQDKKAETGGGRTGGRKEKKIRGDIRIEDRTEAFSLPFRSSCFFLSPVSRLLSPVLPSFPVSLPLSFPVSGLRVSGLQ